LQLAAMADDGDTQQKLEEHLVELLDLEEQVKDAQYVCSFCIPPNLV
jgi:hypothetical protein